MQNGHEKRGYEIVVKCQPVLSLRLYYYLLERKITMKNIIKKAPKKILAVGMSVLSALTVVGTAIFGNSEMTVSAASSYETAYFPGSVLQVNQGAYAEFNAYSHWNQNAFDLGGNTNYTAPFTGKIVDTEPYFHGVLLQSMDKVYYADGTLDYCSVIFMHDNDISNLYKGKVINQGETFYQAGNYDSIGNTTGVHLHIAVCRGKVDKFFYGGNVYPNNALSLKKDITIVQTGGYNWKKDIRGSSVIYDNNVKMMQTIANGRYFRKYTGKSNSIVTALQSIGENSSYAYREKIALYNGISSYCGSYLQNIQMLSLLKQGRLIKPYSSSTITVTSKLNSQNSTSSKTISVIDGSYFSRYTGNTTSIVDALNAIGVDSSYSYRSKIAIANNISNYSGSSEQNLKLLELLKDGKLRKPSNTCEVVVNKASSNISSTTNNPVCFPRYDGNSGSIVDALKAIGVDSSYSYRSKIAAANGISGYSGSASQNVTLLNKLKSGSLIKP